MTIEEARTLQPGDLVTFVDERDRSWLGLALGEPFPVVRVEESHNVKVWCTFPCNGSPSDKWAYPSGLKRVGHSGHLGDLLEAFNR